MNDSVNSGETNRVASLCSDPSSRASTMRSCLVHGQQHSVVNLDSVTRVALAITPQSTGTAATQTRETLDTIEGILESQSVPMTVTKQTVFVRSAEDINTIKTLFELHYGDRVPATSFIIQPPCNGAALAVEAWALGGHGIDVQFPMPDLVIVQYDGLRWIYVAGISSPKNAANAYDESVDSFQELTRRLKNVDATFNDISRVWLYQGGITASERNGNSAGMERYRELNRARTDFFQQQELIGGMASLRDGRVCYPASTGIGMSGGGLSVSGLGLQTDRDDVLMQPLENPRQTSAFDYDREYSLKSPKFSRAMAVKIGGHVTTWISGTASILDSESVHRGDAEKQTEQTIENIQRLIGKDNFTRHGLPGPGATLDDLAKIRVYVKRPEDYEKCRSVCQAMLKSIPAIFAVADVCRPELLVEIEGVAFSNVS